jgi:putative glutamine amidotransferase
MKPIIAVTCDTKWIGKHLYHQTGDKYLTAITANTDSLPLLLPSLDKPLAIGDILSSIDGLLFTGAYANIQRELYGLSPAPIDEPQDVLRDANTLPLIMAAIEAGVPVFGICRGFQELNVAYGGTLHPRIHEVNGRMDHRENNDDPLEVQYGPAHKVSTVEGGMLAAITGKTSFDVNSVHGQGIDRLANGLMVEAVADDGTIESISVIKSKSFALAVQWHPEWQSTSNEQSKKLFRAFGEAVRTYNKTKP